MTLPAGAAVIDLQAEVAGETATDASARVVVVGAGHSETVFEVADGAQQSGAVTADLSAFAGETVTLRLATEGDAQLTVESLRLAIDTDGDGLTDAIERQPIRTGTGETVETDVRFADTDEDGLSDAAELGLRVTPGDTDVHIPGGYYDTLSDPTVPDTDADRVSDFAERRVWGTAAKGADTDGDGYRDLVDAEPTSDSAPPTLQFRSADFGRPVRVRVTDASGIADVELNAWYAEWSGPDADSATDLFTTRQYEPTSVRRVGPTTVEYTFRLDRGGQLNLPPAGYYVNATDTEGNEIRTLVAVNNSTGEASAGGATVTSDGTVGIPIAFGATGLASLESVLGSLVAVGTSTSVLLTAGAAILLVASVYVVVEFTPSRQAPVKYTEGTAVGPATVQGGRYEHLQPVGQQPAPTAETPTAEEIALAAGALYERRGHLRGWGLDYITTSTAISEADIRHVLNNVEQIVPGSGGRKFIIGRGLSDTELIILTIIDGTLLAASGQGTVFDPCGDGFIDLESKEDHYTRDPDDGPEKPFDSRSEVRQLLLLEGVDEAFSVLNGGKRYYIIQLGTNQWTMIVLEAVGPQLARQIGKEWVGWRVRTFLTGDNSPFFTKAENAVKEIGEKDPVPIEC